MMNGLRFLLGMTLVAALSVDVKAQTSRPTTRPGTISIEITRREARCTVLINNIPLSDSDRAASSSTTAASGSAPLDMLVRSGANRIRIVAKAYSGQPLEAKQVCVTVKANDLKDNDPQVFSYASGTGLRERKIFDGSTVFEGSFSIKGFGVARLPWDDADEILMTDLRAGEVRKLVARLIEAYRAKAIDKVLDLLSVKDAHFAQATGRSLKEVTETHRVLIRRYVHDREFSVEVTEPENLEITQIDGLNLFRVTGKNDRPLMKIKLAGASIAVPEYYVASIKGTWQIVR